MFKRLIFALVLSFWGLFLALSHFVAAQGGEIDAALDLRKTSVNPSPAEAFVQRNLTETIPTFPYNSYGSSDFFFPPYFSEGERIGYGKASGHDTSAFKAGWYIDWNANVNPEHPGGAEYARTIYFSIHNTGQMCNGNAPLPATERWQVTANFTGTALITNVQTNPGALWLIGNEPDAPYNLSPIQAELYAELYHYFYTTIKTADPTAKVAIGAISQPSPVRIEYLDKILDHYQTEYGQALPTDLWNIHFYFLNEKICEWGVSLPPYGSSSLAWHLSVKDLQDGRILDMDQAESHLRDFRQWMTDRGYQDIPLIISEYGVLPPPNDYPAYSNEKAALFLRDTFNMFRTLAYTDTGYPADDYRLVQMWNWFPTQNIYFGGDLFEANGEVSLVGMTFGYETLSHFRSYIDLEIIQPASTAVTSTNILSMNLFVNNRGTVTAVQTTFSATLVNYFDGAVVSNSVELIGDYPSRYRQEPLYLVRTWPFTPPMVYTMTMTVDAYQTDVVTSNNRVEELFAVYPDLAVISYTNPTIIDWRKDGVTTFVTTTVSVSATIANVGNWTSTLTPMAMRLQSLDGSLSDTIVLTAPILAPQEIFTLTQSWIVSNTGVYTASVLVNYPYDPTRELFAYNNISATQILIPNHWIFLPLIAKNYSVSSTLVITP